MTETSETIPATEYAVQLVGPEKLELNTAKPVPAVGPKQILARIEAVGLCFSDLKLLKQFSGHVRKGPIVDGLSPEVLGEIPSYVPDEQPTVPGHEGVCRIVAVGEEVTQHKVGERCLIQTDYRALKTAESVAAFGYNFEGALQEYVLMDERVIIDPASGRRFLIPVDEQLPASAVALIEPWACVEDSYVSPERQAIKPRGRLAVVAEAGVDLGQVDWPFDLAGKPLSLTAAVAEPAQAKALESLNIAVTPLGSAEALEEEGYDDIVYFGSDPAVVETLNDKQAKGGILCVCLNGAQLGRKVNMSVGRTHYGLIRWVGDTGTDAFAAYQRICADGEIRDGDRILVVGAGGPMGQMHIIRDICSGKAGLKIVGTDFDDQRLASLNDKAGPMAAERGLTLELVNPKTDPPSGAFDYVALMAPVPQLVAEAIAQANDGCIVNVFAGIPATVKHEIDLDTVIARGVYVFGTSGSSIRDMEIVLEKVQARQLDTNASIDAVCGMAGAAEGIAAVENRTLAGKIIVYPQLHEMGLVPLETLGEHYPTVAEKLANGRWTRAAEEELLRVAQ